MLTEDDVAKLKGVHPDLVLLVTLMGEFCPMPFMVIEGLRTVEAQQANVASGASQTMNSRHLTGHAVDIAPLVDGQITWDWDYYYPFAEHMKGAAALCGTPLEWGGDWTSFKDGPHWQLPWDAYPLEPELPPDPEVVEV